MKSPLSVLVLASALLLVPVRGASAQSTAPLRGDVNGDGAVSALDALAVLTGVVGKALPEGYRLLPNGDADGNGRISAVDALLILAHSVGKATDDYPVGNPLPTIAVAPDSAGVVEGERVRLAATVSGLASERVIWRSGNETVAVVDSTGQVTGLRSALARVAIEAIAAGDTAVRDTAWVRVLDEEDEPSASISIAPSSPVLEVGGSLQLDAALVRGSDSTAAHPAWSSSDAAVASVSAAGLATGAGLGSAWLRAELDGARDSVLVTVMKAVGTVGSAGGVVDSRGDSVRIVFPAGALPSGTTITANPATGHPAHPNLLPDLALELGPDGTTFSQPVTLRVRYDEADLPSGTAEADLSLYRLTGGEWVELDSTWVDPAEDLVFGRLTGFSTYAVLVRPEVADLDATPDSLVVTTGETRQLSVSATDAGSGTRSNRAVAWTSTDTTRATVSSGGLVTAGSAGTARILAVSGAMADTVLVTVLPGALDSLSVVAGGAQTDTVGRALPDSLTVRARDAAGNGVPGVPVVWSVTAGGGSLSADTVDTGADGSARVRWTLGTTPGAQAATASAGGRTASFTATALVGSPARLGIVTQPADSARAGVALTRQPAVRLEDAFGNAVARAGETVTTSLASGDTALAGTRTATTDGDGRASFADLRIDGGVGRRTLAFAATVGGVALDTARSDTVEVLAGAPAALAARSDTLQSAPAGAAVADPPAVRATDAFGNGVPGVTVAFEVAGGQGTVASGLAREEAVTDSAGDAVVSAWTMGPASGEYRLDASTGSLSRAFLAEAGPAAATALALETLPSDTVTAGTPFARQPTVLLRDTFGNVVADSGVAVTVALIGAGSLGGTSTVATDSVGRASFAGLSVEALAGEHWLRFTAAGLASDSAGTEVVAGHASALEVGSGEGGAQVVGTSRTLEAVARDAGGNPVAGVRVAWSVTAGGGTLASDSTDTGADGVASVEWTLGTTAGAQAAAADAAGLAGSPLAFSATAVPDSAAAVVLVTEPSDSVASGVAFPRQPEVRLRDRYGNDVALAGVSVAASIASGDTTLTGTTAVQTDSTGRAAFSDLAIRGAVGTRTLGFAAAGLTPDTSTSVVVGPGEPASVSIVTQPSDTAAAGSEFDRQPEVRLRDASGNAVAAGVDVTATIASGAGTLSGTATASTDTTGLATFVDLAVADSVGAHTLSFTSGSLTAVSAAIEVTAGCARPTLAVGEAYTATMPGAASLCFRGGDSGSAEYVYLPVNVSASQGLSLITMATGIAGVTGPPSPARLPTLAAALALGGEEAAPNDHALRPRGYPVRRPAGRAASPAGLRVPGGPSLSIVRGVPAVGDLWSLNVTRGCTGTPDLRTGRVRAVSATVIVVADTANPAGGFTTAQFDSIAAEMDTLAYPAVTGNFGATGDRDGNGRVVAFFTRAVNELSPPASSVAIPGYFESRDLYAAASCPLSNDGEILYLMVPDPTGAVNSNVRTASSVRGGVVRTLAHELQHLVNANPRVAAAAALEEGWLDEGLSRIAEELVFYRASSGLAPGGNINLSSLTSGPSASRRVAAFNTYANQNFGMLRGWLQRPDTVGVLQPSSSPTVSQQGATWAFLRYAADRAVGGSDQSAFWSSLVSPTTTGKTNLQSAIEADPDDWLRDFSAGIYADDAVAGLAAEYTHPSWDYRSVYGGLGGVPLGVRTLSDGVPLVLYYDYGGTTSFIRFGVPQGETATVETTSGGSIPAGAFKLIVVRTR